MKERPILFNGEMVRAILDGRKTQTRLVVKWPVLSASDGAKRRVYRDGDIAEMNERLETRQRHPNHKCCPYGQPGDRLWVRETWGLRRYTDSTDWNRVSIKGMSELDLLKQYMVEYADEFQSNHDYCYWRPSILMPRWASRITLEITGVRVERLQEITPADAIAEGVFCDGQYSTENPLPYPVATYKALWESINGSGSWDSNPWVWVIKFKRITA